MDTQLTGGSRPSQPTRPCLVSYHLCNQEAVGDSSVLSFLCGTQHNHISTSRPWEPKEQAAGTPATLSHTAGTSDPLPPAQWLGWDGRCPQEQETRG